MILFPERGIVYPFHLPHICKHTVLCYILPMKNGIQLLTVREREVLQLLSTGLTYEKIAEQLEVSHETVKMHLKNIYRKLKAQNKIEALQKVKLL